MSLNLDAWARKQMAHGSAQPPEYPSFNERFTLPKIICKKTNNEFECFFLTWRFCTRYNNRVGLASFRLNCPVHCPGKHDVPDLVESRSKYPTKEKRMGKCTRRDFLKAGAGTAAALGASQLLGGVPRLSAQATSNVYAVLGDELSELYQMACDAAQAVGIGSGPVDMRGNRVFIKMKFFGDLVKKVVEPFPSDVFNPNNKVISNIHYTAYGVEFTSSSGRGNVVIGGLILDLELIDRTPIHSTVSKKGIYKGLPEIKYSLF